MKILDWLANLIFGKRIELYDAETNRPVHKIRIRRIPIVAVINLKSI